MNRFLVNCLIIIFVSFAISTFILFYHLMVNGIYTCDGKVPLRHDIESFNIVFKMFVLNRKDDLKTLNYYDNGIIGTCYTYDYIPDDTNYINACIIRPGICTTNYELVHTNQILKNIIVFTIIISVILGIFGPKI